MKKPKRKYHKLKTDERPRGELQTFKVLVPRARQGISRRAVLGIGGDVQALDVRGGGSMRVDRFYVVGRETPDGTIRFLQTYMAGNMSARHWGEMEFADRYLMFEDAKKAAENTPRQYESDGPATVWRVEVMATKEAT